MKLNAKRLPSVPAQPPAPPAPLPDRQDRWVTNMKEIVEFHVHEYESVRCGFIAKVQSDVRLADFIAWKYQELAHREFLKLLWTEFGADFAEHTVDEIIAEWSKKVESLAENVLRGQYISYSTSPVHNVMEQQQQRAIGDFVRELRHELARYPRE